MSIDSSPAAPAGWRRLAPRWPLRPSVTRRLAIAVAIAAGIFGIATYVLLTGSMSPDGGTVTTVLIMLNIDLVLLLLLGALVAWHLVRLWIERRQGSVGSRLHARIVAMFSLVAVAPAIVVAVFSATFFNLGIQTWFNDRVRTALDRSLAVSEAYLKDHREFIRADILSMVATLNRQDSAVLGSPEELNRLLDAMAGERSLSEAIIVRGDGKILARSRLSFVLEFDPIANAALQRAAEGELVIMTSDESDRIRALARIDGMVGAFLYVGRFVDAEVLNHMVRLSSAVSDYKALEARRSGIQITFTLLYVVVALLLLLAAVWIGLVFTNRLIRPISALVGATERVRAGDLSVRVAEGHVGDEIAALSRAFNRMTGQLESQRTELIEANTQIDNRRRFTEAVLYGVSAGVLGLDRDGRIFLPNQTALDLLAVSADSLVGQPLERAVPEMADLMADLRAGSAGHVQDKVSIIRDNRARELLVRIGAQRTHGRITGYVVTFDDITDLVHAQRAAAWADVARRIAHEIKNPLTPIQLSAERLRRKYRARLGEGEQVFSDCVDTIVRQVGAIRGMVDEFSAFARMPAPVLVEADLTGIVAAAVALQRHAHPEIGFEVEAPVPPVALHCDAAQVGQAMTNMLQNAIDAIDGRAANAAALPPGRVAVRIDASSAERLTVAIEDNGRGLPQDLEQRSRLTEPYVTTRERGTGLGLAIVKKIMEDHGGEVQLTDGSMGGARALLVFPRRSSTRASQGPGVDAVEPVR
ncbi:MAG TPA: PAS domain-containing sensor histidine kinase [Alphaproteobacteria bacterium]